MNGTKEYMGNLYLPPNFVMNLTKTALKKTVFKST